MRETAESNSSDVAVENGERPAGRKVQKHALTVRLKKGEVIGTCRGAVDPGTRFQGRCDVAYRR